MTDDVIIHAAAITRRMDGDQTQFGRSEAFNSTALQDSVQVMG